MKYFKCFIYFSIFLKQNNLLIIIMKKTYLPNN